MSLAGTLSTMPLTDLLQWLDNTRKTGTLVLDNNEYKTTLFLKEGKVVSSSSTDPKSYFGQFLLAHTRISEENLRMAFERQEKTRVYLGKNIYIKTLLGKILVDEGLLSEEEVSRILRLKTEETIYNVFLWQDGTFNFLVNELPPEELVPISLDIVLVLNHGIQRMEEWKDIRSRIPSNGATFRVFPERMLPGVRLNDFTAKILTLLGEGRTLHDIMLSLHATEFAVNHAAYRFLRDGFVTLAGELPLSLPPLRAPAPAQATPEELVEQGQALFDQRSYADTIIAARQALRSDPAHPEARKLLERSERELTDSFYSRYFSPADVPCLEQPFAAADLARLSPEERFLLERVNGSWTVNAILKVSPLKEVDAVAIFKKFVDQKVISIRRG